MKTLILGATGFIGQNISHQFKNATKVGSKFHDFETGSGYEKFECCDVIIDCVGRYGGLPFNKKYGNRIFYQNSMINLNIKKLIDLLQPKRYIKIYSAVIYPNTNQLVNEEILNYFYNPADSVKWSALPQINDINYLKQSNIPFDALIVTNCYGKFDHYDNDKSHIIGSLLSKMSQNPKEVSLIGTGLAKRDFVYAEDIGIIVKELLKNSPSNQFINVSSSELFTISEVVNIIVEKYNYSGKILWGDERDNGVLYKGLDNSKLKLLLQGFNFTSFQKGIDETIKNFKRLLL